MEWTKRLLVWGMLLGVTVAMAGCSTANNIHERSTNIMNSIQPNSTTRTNTSHASKDGTIVSLKFLEQYSGTSLKMYQVMYWSNGFQVEAYATEPVKPGKYPLIVCLHGGAVWPADSSSDGYTAQTVDNLANSSTVMLYPEYEGYMDSQGFVQGLAHNKLDVMNAITAVKSLGEVQQNDTYLLGNSMGGCLALMTAETDNEVKAVVAVSPFAGLNDFVSWAKTTNAKEGSIFYSQLYNIELAYGDTVGSKAYNDRSPDTSKINAPVLLLQGTGDDRVPWQTVQTLYDQLKKAHKVVKLVLYPGGQHGLKNQYQLQSQNEIDNWFNKYGLSVKL